MKLILLSLSLACITTCFDSTSIVCALIPYKASLSDNLTFLWGKVILQNPDRYAFLIISPILIISAVVVLKFYHQNPKIMGRTGIIYIVIIIFEIFLNLHYLISAIYNTITKNNLLMPSSFPLFCQINSIVAAFFQILHIIFVLLVPIYIVYILRSSLKSNSKMWEFVYFIVAVGSAIATYLMWNQGVLGLNIFGLCGVTFIRFPNANIGIPITMICITGIFLLLGIFSIRYFKRHMPNSIGLRKKKKYQIQMIILYVVGYAVFGIVQSVILLVLYMHCNQINPKSDLSSLISVFNFINLIECLFIYFVIFRHQNSRRAFKKFLKKLFSRKKYTKSQSTFLKEDVIQNDTSSNPNNGRFNNFQQVLLSIHQQNESIDILKISQVLTIVSGIYIAYKQYYNIKEEYFHNVFTDEFASSQDNLSPISSQKRNTGPSLKKSTKNIYYHQKMSIKINIQIVKDFIQDPTLLPKFGILSCSMIIHSPKIFQHLIQNDQLQSIFQSFQLHQNARKMFDLAQGQGGRSGQFFFYSSDNKFVLKTITPQEFQFIDKNLFYFHQHFIRNPDSILAKIYGLFTFKGYQIQRTYHLILMKNMIACNNTQILRTYDLKGSRYDREVNINKIEANQLQKITLKDIDFMKQQGRIHVSNEDKVNLSLIITKDTLFLKNLNLIDYSLLVIKVKWLVPPKNSLFWSRYQRIQSCVNQDEYYHIGMIDYLQQWDLQKKGQKWWKNLLGKKDISAQQPKYYQHRFVTFVGEITQEFCLRQEFGKKKQNDNIKTELTKKKIQEGLLNLQRLQRQGEILKQKITCRTAEVQPIQRETEIQISVVTRVGSQFTRYREQNQLNQSKQSTYREDDSARSRAGSSSFKKYLAIQTKQKHKILPLQLSKQ